MIIAWVQCIFEKNNQFKTGKTKTEIKCINIMLCDHHTKVEFTQPLKIIQYNKKSV